MSRPLPHHYRLGGLALSVVVLAAACSIPTDEQARPVQDTQQLTTTTPIVAQTAGPDDGTPYGLPLFFFNADDGLVRLDRGHEEPPVVQDILDALANAPTPEEVEEYPGIATRFLPEMQPRAEGAITEDGLLSVRVQGPELREFAATNPERVQRIYTQIVCSMDATGIISMVQILDDDGAIRVQGSDGAVLDRPLSSADVNCTTAEEAQAAAADAAEASGTGDGVDGIDGGSSGGGPG